MELGLISLSDLTADPHTGRPVPAVDRLDATLAYARAADELGLDAFALGEHHSHKFAIASPAVVLATIAAEKLDLLLRLREHERITWSGRYRPQLVDAEIAPRAVQQPLPVWVGVGGTPTSAARAGHLGLPMMLGYIGGTLAHARRAVDIYRAAGAAAGHDPEALQVGISTHFYAAASEQDAADVFDHYRTYLHPDTNNGRGFVVDRATFNAARRRDGALMIGTPEQLAEKILDAHAALGITRFIGQFDWGGLPPARVQDSIARLATEIAPAVRTGLSACVT